MTKTSCHPVGHSISTLATWFPHNIANMIDILVSGTLSLSGLSSIMLPQGYNLRFSCLMYTLDPFYNTMVDWPLMYCPLSKWLHIGIFCIGVFLSLLSIWLVLRVQPLWFIVYILLVICYTVVIYGVCLFLMLRGTGIGLRLFCVLWLWPCCWAF